MDRKPFMKEEYETQYFGFHPSAFTDAVYSILFDYIHEALNSFQAYLCKKYGHLMSAEDIHSGTDAILQITVRKLDAVFDRLEIFLNNEVLIIPNHVVLPEDKIHVTRPVTKGECDQLDLDIADLEQKILEAKMKRAYLKQKLRDQKSVLQVLKLQRDKFEMLKSSLNIADTEGSLPFAVTKALELIDCL